jgi:hypothetical protein
MKTITIFLCVLVFASLVAGCGSVGELVQQVSDARSITPSDTIITETRDVSGFDAIEMSTFGKVNLVQGDSESLTITGSDNIVPLIKTTVSNGKLTISTVEPIFVTRVDKDHPLTFDIMVKDLSRLVVSGAGDFQMDSLTAESLVLDLSGAGNVNFSDFNGTELDVTLSGAGGLEIAGKVNQLNIEVSGVGGVNAGDLESQTAETNISGLGGITVWVTDELTGEISGGGSVSYYGDPTTNTSTSGIGSFKPLGEK